MVKGKLELAPLDIVGGHLPNTPILHIADHAINLSIYEGQKDGRSKYLTTLEFWVARATTSAKRTFSVTWNRSLSRLGSRTVGNIVKSRYELEVAKQ